MKPFPSLLFLLPRCLIHFFHKPFSPSLQLIVLRYWTVRFCIFTPREKRLRRLNEWKFFSRRHLKCVESSRRDFFLLPFPLSHRILGDNLKKLSHQIIFWWDERKRERNQFINTFLLFFSRWKKMILLISSAFLFCAGIALTIALSQNHEVKTLLPSYPVIDRMNLYRRRKEI